MIELFQKAPVTMTVAFLIAAVIGGGISYLQNQPKVDELNKQVADLNAELQELQRK